jgi:hypothetical protein
MPLFIILVGTYHLSLWYEDIDLPQDWVVRTTVNSWTNNITGLEWLKYFNEYTKVRTIGAYRILILDGHESHYSFEFRKYCHIYNIIYLELPPYSSYLTQLFDVSCFGLLKKVYGTQIEEYIRANIIYISKPAFLSTFKITYSKVITSKNIQAGFHGAGIIPLNPEEVLSKMDIRLQTPPPTTLPNTTWISQIPYNPTEAIA